MKHKTKIAGIALLCLALGSQALTLGRIRGAVLVGRPLDVAVQVQLDASESAASLCFEADVFHGDTRQEASRVRVRVEPTTQAQSVQVRILSSAIIDEPVVTVYLRSGCQQKITRTYVLLAELTSEVAPPLPALLGNPSATSRASAPAPWTQPVATPEAAQPALRAERSAPRRAENAAPAKPKGVMSGATRKVAPPAGQPRLKLDLLELMEDREPTLNFSTEMLTQPSADPLRRAEAAALWRALNASPEEILRQSAQALALQADVSSLKTLTAKNQDGLSDLATRLHRAESERFSAWVVYALLAALLACLAALALVWRRQRPGPDRDQDWWDRANTGQPASVDMIEPKARPEPRLEPVAPVRSPTATVTAPSPPVTTSGHAGLWKDSSPASNMDVSMVEVSHSIFDELMQADADRLTTPGITAASANTAPTRSLNALTIISQQQVNLLVAQGRPEQAVGLLKQHLHDGGSPNPALYLELLSLLHTLGLKTDFLHYREEFGRFFTGKIPEFSTFKNEGRSLDAYPQFLSRIAELWPSLQVQEVLAACIFQDHYEAKHQPFDLAAFRELLLLYAVAQRLALMPPAVNSEAAPAMPTLLDLDLDLSEALQAPAGAGPMVDLDIDIALPISDGSSSEAPGAHLSPPSQHGNMIDFDPPEMRKNAPPRRG
ncbi:MAG: hypothetical protein ACYC4S_04940 [Rhodoferax sp.]